MSSSIVRVSALGVRNGVRDRMSASVLAVSTSVSASDITNLSVRYEHEHIIID
jgi:hypothetical protein